MCAALAINRHRPREADIYHQELVFQENEQFNQITWMILVSYPQELIYKQLKETGTEESLETRGG